MNRSIAIQFYCAYCQNHPGVVELCQDYLCPLFPYRLGCSLESRKYQRLIAKAEAKEKKHAESVEKRGT